MEKPRWEDFSVFGINKEPAHNLALPYGSRAATLEKGRTPYKRSLNGTWKFYHQFGTSLLPQGFSEPNFNDNTWNNTPVPSVWQLEGYGKPVYLAASYPKAICTQYDKMPAIDDSENEVGIYRRAFHIPASWAGRAVYVYFGAVKSAFTLYVNGQEIGYSQGSMTGAEFHITPWLREGENNMTVVVYRYSDGTYFEDQDMWFLSGIYREVYLYAEAAVCVRDFHLDATPDNTFSNATGKLYLKVKNHTDTNADISVRTLLIREGRETLLCETSSSLGANETKDLSLPVHIQDIVLWSAEKPNLYRLLLEVTSVGQTEYKSVNHGFKKIEIQGDVLLVNGMPVKLKGTNRHDFYPDSGWAVPLAVYQQDILLMKRNNINAVRTSHYPDDHLFYELCDEYGIYVMDECDIETHGVGMPPMPLDGDFSKMADAKNFKPFPGDRKDVLPALLDRLERMVLRDRSHPSVCIWSMGNESGAGSVFVDMYNHVKALDPSRPVHYEGDKKNPCSDFYSSMYTPAQVIDLLAQGKDSSPDQIDMAGVIDSPLANAGAMFRTSSSVIARRPIVLCEYVHAMENSLGNFKEYWDVIERHKNISGAFIWDFVDQSIRRKTPLGEEWLYGGDFDEDESNYYFCANGIVAGDRTPHPSLFEVKRIYQNVKFTLEDAVHRKIRIQNGFYFTDLSDFRLVWAVDSNGVRAASGSLQDLSLAPQAEATVSLPFDLAALPAETELFLNLALELKEDANWAQHGHNVANAQLLLRNGSTKILYDTCPGNTLLVYEKQNAVMIHNENILVEISPDTGLVTRIALAGRDIISAPLVPNYFRALTDNDRGVANFNPKQFIGTVAGIQWKQAGSALHLEEFRIEDCNDGIQVTSRYSHSLFKDTVLLTYTILREGVLRIRHSATPLKSPYRLGFITDISTAYTMIEWYGRGPHENYCDRKQGADISLYKANAIDMGHNYLRPQENGNRTDVRWLRLSDRYGASFTIQDITGSYMGFAIHPYTQDELDASEHIHELPNNDRFTLNLDAMQCGVGGDLPGFTFLKQPYIIHAGQAYLQEFEIF